MLAYKTQLSISNEFLFLRIPSSFKGKRVEIIVLETSDLSESDILGSSNQIETFYDTFSVSSDENISESLVQEPNDFQRFLLSSPTWSDDDYQNFVDTRKLFNQWKIE